MENYVVITAAEKNALSADLLAHMTEVDQVMANSKSLLLLRSSELSC